MLLKVLVPFNKLRPTVVESKEAGVGREREERMA